MVESAAVECGLRLCGWQSHMSVSVKEVASDVSIRCGECSSRVLLATLWLAVTCVTVGEGGGVGCVDRWWREQQTSVLSVDEAEAAVLSELSVCGECSVEEVEEAEQAVLTEPSGGGQCSRRVCCQ